MPDSTLTPCLWGATHAARRSLADLSDLSPAQWRHAGTAVDRIG